MDAIFPKIEFRGTNLIFRTNPLLLGRLASVSLGVTAAGAFAGTLVGGNFSAGLLSAFVD